MTGPIVSVQEISDGVVLMTLEDRMHKNGFSNELVEGLLDAFSTIRNNHRYRVVIVTGYDTYFATGGTLEGLLAIHEGRTNFAVTNFYSLALECPIPVISAMQGHAIGGGLVFGLYADFVVLAQESIYAANFMKYGFTPGMGATCVLPTKLGFSLASELLIGARSYRGEDLARRGVAFPVMPRCEVHSYACELGREVALKPRASLIELKAHLVADIRRDLAHVVEKELAMHAATFHQPEVGDRIRQLFGH